MSYILSQFLLKKMQRKRFIDQNKLSSEFEGCLGAVLTQDNTSIGRTIGTSMPSWQDPLRGLGYTYRCSKSNQILSLTIFVLPLLL